MQLFCLRTTTELLEEYIRESYVSIHLPWLNEDVEFIAWEQLCAKYVQAPGSEQLHLFVYEMQDGDLVIVSDGQSAYLGDLGDYFFVDAEQNVHEQLPPRTHRRGVTWLKPIGGQLEKMAHKLQQFIRSTEALAKYEDDVTLEGMEELLENKGKAATVIVDDELISEAIGVLKQALYSDDVERRERAAIALLNFARK